jgi:DNA-binding LacI/PurR family transcriptional regulator
VPGDLSLVGYNTYLARIRHLSPVTCHLSPVTCHLTSVDNGNFAVGLQAGRYVLERRENRGLPQRLHLVPTQLLVRGSTGHAPDSA